MTKSTKAEAANLRDSWKSRMAAAERHKERPAAASSTTLALLLAIVLGKIGI
jgi:hypothetical protein